MKLKEMNIYVCIISLFFYNDRMYIHLYAQENEFDT